MNISIIICCYNSENRIINTLLHLSQCVITSNGIIDEIILVDNNSSDSTVKTAMNFWKQFCFSDILHVVHEENAGLSYARKRGILTSKNEIVVFCDDDNWLLPIYFLNLKECFNDQKVGAVGGRGIPIANVNIPDWFFDNLDAYACSEQNSNMLYGASLAIRTNILRDFYNDEISNKLSGRTKNSLDSGEDNLLCEFIKSKGYKLIPDNTPFCHFMEQNRLNTHYLFKLAESFGKATAAIKNNNNLFFDILYLLSKAFYSIFKSYSKRNKMIYLKREFHFAKGYISNRKKWIK